jgi:hypothetical protein
VQKEIERMLVTLIIYPIDKSKWANPMVVQIKNPNPKKYRIYITFRGLNKVTLTDHFPTPFTNKIINEVAGHECYSITNGVLGYNQVPITKENQEKTTFISKFSSFAYKVIPFRLKNSPTIFSRIVVKAFQEYIYKTMAIYFDDWICWSFLFQVVEI